MRIVILGAGQAAASMAARLRSLGHNGPLTVIGAEPLAPYQRPPLSKAYLLGEMGLDRLLLRAPDFWAEAGIDMRTAERGLAIDRAGRVLQTDRGSHPYDALALCLGAAPRRLPAAKGGHLPGVHTIRDLADVDRLAPQMRPGARLVVIGGGYIGLEAAAVARRLGMQVTLIEAAPRILGRVAAAETAAMIRALHARHGVTLIEGAGLGRITGEDRALGVDLADGRHLPADLVITGIGVTPETALAEAAGLAIDNGIATDATGRSSDPAIWAAGDCASFPHDCFPHDGFPHDGGRLRLESVGNAIDMGEAVAANMLGADTPYVARPWFWSDQFDAKLQIAGLNAGYDQTVFRPGARPGEGSTWYYRAGRLIAVDALNEPRAYMIGKRLIESGRSPEPQAVAHAPDLKALMS